MTNGEAFMCGTVPFLLLLSVVGWVLVIRAADLRRDDDGVEDMPRDASWLDKTPPWMTILFIGILILFLVQAIGHVMNSLLL